MSFSFNFNVENVDCSPEQVKTASFADAGKQSSLVAPEQYKEEPLEERQGKKHDISDRRLKVISSSLETKWTSSDFCGGDVFIRHVVAADVQADIAIRSADNDWAETDCTAAIEAQSDLIPGIYEGGLKVWECTRDLVEFLHRSSIDFFGKSVLEIGCGAGLPGIYAAQAGARSVCFQDYNEEVINLVTIPNVSINVTNLSRSCQRRATKNARTVMKTDGHVPVEAVGGKKNDKKTVPTAACHFYSGDWAKLKELWEEDVERHQYDVIITSETIYRPSAQRKLLDLIKLCLAKPNGVLYLAAKVHYFGVGGGTRDFEELVKADDSLDVEVVHSIKGGVVREVLRLWWKAKEPKEKRRRH